MPAKLDFPSIFGQKHVKNLLKLYKIVKIMKKMGIMIKNALIVSWDILYRHVVKHVIYLADNFAHHAII